VLQRDGSTPSGVASVFPVCFNVIFPNASLIQLKMNENWTANDRHVCSLDGSGDGDEFLSSLAYSHIV